MLVVDYSTGTMRRLLEHRLVVERALRRPLRRNEQVHHINGAKADNRLENLVVLSPREHGLLHAAEKRDQ